MRPHRLEVADVFHAHQQEFLERWGPVVSRQQHKALRDIGLCRTAALGAHLQRCDACSYQDVSYLSCRNRHCPKCQSTARDRWLCRQARQPVAGGLFPRRLHPAGATGTACTPQPTPALRPAVSRRLRNPARDRR